MWNSVSSQQSDFKLFRPDNAKELAGFLETPVQNDDSGELRE
jgi:hypothetical protein